MPSKNTPHAKRSTEDAVVSAAQSELIAVADALESAAARLTNVLRHLKRTAQYKAYDAVSDTPAEDTTPRPPAWNMAGGIELVTDDLRAYARGLRNDAAA